MNEIEINYDRKCARCEKPGALKNGICMQCMAKAMAAGEFNHLFKPSLPAKEPPKPK